ncbi:MAG: isoprenylcysteine carboxylmethyltransferase family protein, partial [Oligoflexia bacterium]|nr:isoprenylcysteine carboxylmethyltransferase family protein [Oligoflexia bacterium]
QGAPAAIAGLATSALGVAFAVWARAHLGRMWSGSITLKQDHHLVRSGP